MLQRRNDSLGASIERFLGDFAPFFVSPFPPPDPESMPNDGVFIGTAIDQFGSPAGNIWLPVNSLAHHALVSGTTGTGKTWTTVSIIAQLIRQGKPVWVFDRLGDITRYLLWLFGPERINVFDLSTFRQNPLEARNWKQALTRLRRPMREEYLRDGSLNLGGKIIRELFESDGPMPPTFQDLYDAVDQKRFRAVSRYAAYKESLENRLFAWTNFIEAYNCRIGFPIKELLRQNCVFHLDIREVPPDLAAFFMKVLLVFVEAEMMDTSEGELHLEIVLDELHLVDSREMENRNDLGEAMLRQSFRSLRHCGVGILGGDQLAALVPNTLIGLMNTKIAFLTPDGPSQLTLASSMTLDNEQRDFLGKLDRDKRQAVMHSSEFGGGAFLVQMPQMKLQKASLEEVAAAKKLAAERFPWTPIEPTITERPVDLRKALGGKHHEVRDVERSDVMTGASPEIEKQTKSEEQFLAVELLDYLRAVARDLLVTKTTRYKQLHLSAGKGDRLSDALVERGLIEEIKVPTGKRGGQPILLDITKAGRDLLARHHIKVNVPRGKGGLKHAFFQNAVQKWFAANFPNGTANIEDTDNDAHKAVDVAFVGDSKKIAVEILVNGVEKELSNIEADLEFEEIWMVAESRDQLARLQQKVQSSFPHHISRIQFHLITRFIAEMKSNGR